MLWAIFDISAFIVFIHLIDPGSLPFAERNLFVFQNLLLIFLFI